MFSKRTIGGARVHITLLGVHSLGNERAHINSAISVKCTIGESSLDLPYGAKHAKHAR
jgi:hypothetical protein